MDVYVLQHERDLDGCDEVKLIGVYRSRHEAEQARDRMRLLPGFADHPDGFSIDAYEIGRDQWAEGFIEAATRASEGSEAA